MINVASIIIYGVDSGEANIRSLRPRAEGQVVEVDVGHAQRARAASDGSLIDERHKIGKSSGGDGHDAVLAVHICCVRSEAGNRQGCTIGAQLVQVIGESIAGGEENIGDIVDAQRCTRRD